VVQIRPSQLFWWGTLYAKIYEQIFDSSIAENYQVRHVFEDLLKLADQDGTVNRTHEVIARRTNVPLEMVRMAIAELEKPDPRSQSRIADGARLVRLDPTRDWGWKIVDHGYYRALRTAEEKRESDKERQRKNREDKELSGKKLQKLQSVTPAYASVSASVPEGRNGGEDYHEVVVDHPGHNGKGMAWTKQAIAAYGETLDQAGASIRSKVSANCNELLSCGKPEDRFAMLCDWCKHSKNEHKPKDAISATDPVKWQRWQRMMDEEIERASKPKRGGYAP
jgi:hypothetical protein